MMQQEFINKVLGLPWVNRACSFAAVDCYGLVMLYYKHVLGIDLDEPKGYANGEPVADCWDSETQNPHWIEKDSPMLSGVVFTCYSGGQPAHVGLYIGDGKVLHCRGSEKEPGSVAIHNIRAVERLCGKMTYHIHADLL